MKVSTTKGFFSVAVTSNFWNIRDCACCHALLLVVLHVVITKICEKMTVACNTNLHFILTCNDLTEVSMSQKLGNSKVVGQHLKTVVLCHFNSSITRIEICQCINRTKVGMKIT